MASVTSRIGEIIQPRGGYIKPSEFETIVLNDGIELNTEENIHATLVGLVVDYLTRFIKGTDVVDAFEISFLGANCAEFIGVNDAVKVAKQLSEGIKRLDETSIINACKLVTFDAWYRNPNGAMMSKGYNEINPDEGTIKNIKTLVERSVSFFDKYGPITKSGFTFESPKEKYENGDMTKNGGSLRGGYTSTVSIGDGDFLTKDTLWDFKVSKKSPTSKQTLQLLMYWIMGQHSGQEIFKNITKLGIFNPRLNTVYLLEMSKVRKDIIKIVEDEVICY